MKSLSNNLGFSLARDLLLEGQSVSMRVQGQSMLPFFRSGQRVVLRPLREGDIRCGRVVMGEAVTGHFQIHRIIRVEEDHVILFGDGNIIGTEKVMRDHIYGIIECGFVHLFFARLWFWIRPLRKYPLWFLRRIFPK